MSSTVERTTIRCVVCGGLHLNAHEADGRIDRLERVLAEADRRLREIVEAVEGRVDITPHGQPNLAMRIEVIAKGRDKP